MGRRYTHGSDHWQCSSSFQFVGRPPTPGARKAFRIRRGDIPKRHVRLQAINTRSMGVEPVSLSGAYSTEPFIIFSWVFALSIPLGVVYVLCLQQR